MSGIQLFLDRSADSFPSRIAISYGDLDVSYGELQRDSFRLANKIAGLGLVDGARVATWMPNHPASFLCMFAINRTTSVWMPLNHRSSLHEALELLVDFDASWLFIHSEFAAHVDAIRTRAPSLLGIVCVDRELDGAPFLDEWVSDAPPNEPRVLVRPMDTAVLRTTGGSTGKPKGVQRSNLCQSLQVMDYLAALPYDEPPRNLVLAPLSHAAGSAAIPIFEKAGTQVILNSTSPQDILQSIQTHRITTVFMPPTLIYALLAFPRLREYDLSSLRYLIYGTAPMSKSKLIEGWDVFGPVFTQIYGMTEASSTISIMTPKEHAAALHKHPERLASCGRGSANYRIKIAAKDGTALPPRQIGEVACLSSEIMTGYYQNEEATRETVRDGWLYTGDVGFVDEEGYLHIVDRIKDIIISGGFNVYPGEVEQVIFSHPAIRDCAVVGAPDDKWGEAVTAVVELKPGASIEPAELIAHCKTLLGSVKCPKTVHVWADLPRSPVGKVLRKSVRAEFWKSASRAI
ncbi:AMP-binding protein [Pectobacterium actinidiae]|uniref:AMP-binding protein n=1 Tax=Pectobacterium actinidiae TaxID=1507808 RepID=UPI0038233EE2